MKKAFGSASALLPANLVAEEKLMASQFAWLRLVLLTLAALFLVSPVSHANIIAPGGSTSPDVFVNLTGASPLASNSVTFIQGGPGAFVSAVYRDPNNTFGAGDLAFLYQISNPTDSGGSITLVSDASFAGFSTDIGYATNGGSLAGGMFVNGTVAPNSVNRSSGGITVNFVFPTGPFAQGTTSAVLVIETNATNFDASGSGNIAFTFEDPGLPAFEPAAATTRAAREPGTLALLGSGLLCAAALGRRLHLKH